MATRVGSIQAGGAASQTSWVTSFPQAPTANNLLLLTISRGRTGAAATLGGLSGWTLMGSGAGSRSTQSINCDLYARIATGGDAAPTITASASSNLQWNLEEWSGLSTTLPTAGIPNTWTMQNASGGGGVVVSDTEVADVDNEWVFAVLAGRGGSGGNPSFTWDSDLTANQNTASGSNRYLFTATGSIASSGGSLVASFTVVNGQGDGMDCLGMVGFAPLPAEQTVTPTGIASGSAFGAPALTPGAVTIAPTAITAGATFGAHTLAPGAVTVTPAGIASGAAFGTPTITAGPATVQPTGFVAPATFGTPAVAPAQSVEPSGIAAGVTFGTPVLSPGPVTVSPPGSAVPVAFGTASVVGVTTVAPTGFAHAVEFGTANLSLTIVVDGIGASVSFGTATIASDQAVTVSGISVPVTFGTAGISGEIEIPRDPRATITRRTRKATITKRTATATITHTSEKAVIP